MKKTIIAIITIALIGCSITYKKNNGETDLKIEICKNPETCKEVGEMFND